MPTDPARVDAPTPIRQHRALKRFKAIAAMSLNRVIGNGNQLPWRLPEDFKWFKQMTTGQIIVMGRKTFESIGRPLPNRTTIVLSRSRKEIPGVQTAPDLATVSQSFADPDARQIFICGGAQVYEQALPMCTDLYLTLVNRVVEGDAFFPPFEECFELAEVVVENPEFKILHFRERSAKLAP
jgi:dihydrofolate reductase